MVCPRLARFGQDIASIYAKTSCLDETDIAFVWSNIWQASESLGAAELLVKEWLKESKQQADSLLRQLDALVSDAYHVNAAAFTPNDYQTMEETFSVEDEKLGLARLLVSFMLGCMF